MHMIWLILLNQGVFLYFGLSRTNRATKFPIEWHTRVTEDAPHATEVSIALASFSELAINGAVDFQRSVRQS